MKNISAEIRKVHKKKQNPRKMIKGIIRKKIKQELQTFAISTIKSQSCKKLMKKVIYDMQKKPKMTRQEAVEVIQLWIKRMLIKMRTKKELRR